MKIRRKIQFTGKNLYDVFSLPCVKAIIKTGDATPVLILWPHCTHGIYVAPIGTTLTQFEDGHWEVDV